MADADADGSDGLCLERVFELTAETVGGKKRKFVGPRELGALLKAAAKEAKAADAASLKALGEDPNAANEIKEVRISV